MTRSKLGLKILGLCAALLSLMAVAAGSAQAEPTSFWSVVNPTTGVLTKITTEALLPEIQIKEIEELKDAKDPGRHLVLLTTVGPANTPLSILCSTAELENAAGTAAPRLLKEGSALGRGKFTGCITKIKGVTSAPCKPHSPGAALGTILTNLIKALIRLHTLIIEGKEVKDSTVLLAADIAGQPMVPLILGEEGPENECAVGEKFNIEGELVVWDCLGNVSFSEEKIDHLFEEFPGLRLVTFGGRPATIDGSVILHLVGEHLNFKWGGTPG